MNQNDANLNYFNTGEWKNLTYKGFSIYKYPSDLLTYQNIIWKTKPDIIIETGTCTGASALFFLDTLKCCNIENPLVVTIGLGEIRNCVPETKGIKKIVGSCLAPAVIDQVTNLIRNKSVLVSLDSDHTRDHVSAELEIYSSFVSPGQYIVVEDTFLGYYGPFLGAAERRFQENTGQTPKHAVEDFLTRNKDFIIDESCNKYISMTPNGFLRRLK